MQCSQVQRSLFCYVKSRSKEDGLTVKISHTFFDDVLLLASRLSALFIIIIISIRLVKALLQHTNHLQNKKVKITNIQLLYRIIKKN